MLVHLSKNGSGSFSYNPVSVNFLTEVFKTLFALCMLLALVSLSTPGEGDSREPQLDT